MPSGTKLGTKLRAVVVALSIGLGACTALKEGMEDSQRTSSTLKSELGLDAQVSVRTMNGHTTVNVYLAKPPPGDATTSKAQIEDVVNRSFRVKVEHVNVSF